MYTRYQVRICIHTNTHEQSYKCSATHTCTRTHTRKTNVWVRNREISYLITNNYPTTAHIYVCMCAYKSCPQWPLQCGMNRYINGSVGKHASTSFHCCQYHTTTTYIHMYIPYTHSSAAAGYWATGAVDSLLSLDQQLSAFVQL